jgi:hypothetical protein
MEPRVPTAVTPRRVNRPSRARLPARGRITSDGMGGKMFSRNITMTRPGYPMVLTTDCAHVTIVLRSSLNPICYYAYYPYDL